MRRHLPLVMWLTLIAEGLGLLAIRRWQRRRLRRSITFSIDGREIHRAVRNAS